MGFAFGSVQAVSTTPTVTTAKEGLSLEGTDVTWGQLVGTVGDPARLTTNREVPLNGKEIDMKGPGFFAVTNGATLFVQNDSQINGTATIGNVVATTMDVQDITGDLQIAVVQVSTPLIAWMDAGVGSITGIAIFGNTGAMNYGDQSAVADDGPATHTFRGSLATTSTLQTEDPGSGSGQWKLGKVVVAGVALDATQYVEVEIDGAVVKLAIVS